ncbi:hypothetical protein PTKIN_Ptkin02bG0009300 [Pterospermum kingtungense]
MLTKACDVNTLLPRIYIFASTEKIPERGVSEDLTAHKCLNGETMEGEERKSEPKGAVLGGSHKRAREDDEEAEETAVTEEEVEEFFAILRRIQVAVNYFKKGNGDVRKITELEKVEVNGVEKKGVEEENVEENMDLDLNAYPDTGSDRV